MKSIHTLIFTVCILVIIVGNIFGGPERDKKAPELPLGCERLRVSEGSKLAFSAYAIGVQVYIWNGTSWEFVAPIANLYADEGLNGQVGTHYIGPTWESNSGSKVVARRAEGCSPRSTAIAWLLLDAVASEGPGIFHRIAQIQRLNTVGGLPPTEPGVSIGDEARVPYTAEYYFYRKGN